MELKIKLTTEQLSGIMDLVESIDDDLMVTYSLEDLCYNTYSPSINIPIEEYVIMDNEAIKIFKKVLKEEFQKFLLRDLDLLVIAILHEIGHYMTDDDEIAEKRYLAIGILEFQKSYKMLSIDELQYRYFKLPGEIDATTWAINYYNSHRKQCKKLSKLFKKC